MQLIKLTDYRNGSFYFGTDNLLHMQPVSAEQLERLKDGELERFGNLDNFHAPHTSLFLNNSTEGAHFLIAETCEEVAELIHNANTRNLAPLRNKLEEIANGFEEMLNETQNRLNAEEVQ